jgi:hypothetical protein
VLHEAAAQARRAGRRDRCGGVRLEPLHKVLVVLVCGRVEAVVPGWRPLVTAGLPQTFVRNEASGVAAGIAYPAARGDGEAVAAAEAAVVAGAGVLEDLLAQMVEIPTGHRGASVLAGAHRERVQSGDQ